LNGSPAAGCLVPSAAPLRNATHAHGRLVILTVRRPMRAGPRAHRESASGQKRTPITEYRKNTATCHASPPTGAFPHLAPLGALPRRTRTPAAGGRPGDRQAGPAPSAPHATQSGEGAGRCHGAVYFAARRGDVLSGANTRIVEAGEDPKFMARRMGIFASELQVPSGRGHAAPAGLVNLKKLEDRVRKTSSRCHLSPGLGRRCRN
jgi:hypothetical protein